MLKENLRPNLRAARKSLPPFPTQQVRQLFQKSSASTRRRIRPLARYPKVFVNKALIKK
jgi:hypothetical protein